MVAGTPVCLVGGVPVVGHVHEVNARSVVGVPHVTGLCRLGVDGAVVRAVDHGSGRPRAADEVLRDPALGVVVGTDPQRAVLVGLGHKKTPVRQSCAALTASGATTYDGSS